MLQRLLALVSGATMLEGDEPTGKTTQKNDAGGFSDGRSECNYDAAGMFSCKLVQPAPTSYPAWQGTPETWDTR